VSGSLNLCTWARFFQKNGKGREVWLQGGKVNITNQIAAMGHRSDVRAVALSDDDATLLSTGSGGTKLWSSQHGTILNNVDTGYGLSALFAPGGRYAVVGCKSGHCDIVDVGMATTVDSVEAHSAQVCQMQQPVTRVNSIMVYSLKLLLECSLVA
jgi:WD40 repeat protein